MLWTTSKGAIVKIFIQGRTLLSNVFDTFVKTDDLARLSSTAPAEELKTFKE